MPQKPNDDRRRTLSLRRREITRKLITAAKAKGQAPAPQEKAS